MHILLNLRILFKNYIFQRHVINQINRPTEYKEDTKNITFLIQITVLVTERKYCHIIIMNFPYGMF